VSPRAVFDEPNLVSHGDLVVMAFAERAGLPKLLSEHIRLGGEYRVNAQVKIDCLVAGADSSTTWACCGTGPWTCCSWEPLPHPRSGRTCVPMLGERPVDRAGRPGIPGPANADAAQRRHAAQRRQIERTKRVKYTYKLLLRPDCPVFLLCLSIDGLAPSSRRHKVGSRSSSRLALQL
jgi:hypothetical protein